jgi:hypothetical protein
MKLSEHLKKQILEHGNTCQNIIIFAGNDRYRDQARDQLDAIMQDIEKLEAIKERLERSLTSVHENMTPYMHMRKDQIEAYLKTILEG